MTVEVAMVLAAGFGTRLRPMTLERPKPLVPVGDRTVLEHVVARLAAAGIRRVVVNAHHLAKQVEALAPSLALPTTVVREAEILGTSGGVAQAADALDTDGPVLVHNGDILADLSLGELIRAHQTHPGAWATLAVMPTKVGAVGLDGRAQIVRLRSQRHAEEVEAADFCGVQILSAAARAALVTPGCLVGDVHMPALARGVALHAARIVTHFDDIGTPAAYLAANHRWLGDRAAWCHETAELADGVSLERTVVGAGAVVRGRGVLRRCVVWPGAEAVAPLSDAVVTPRHVVWVVSGSNRQTRERAE